jgi:pimeloyl-ACP methyl ester carboxylesterase
LTLKTLVFLHGYGVRGFFWEPIKTFFESKFPQIFLPDLDMADLETLINSTKNYLKNLVEKYETNIFLVGHSLGGVIGAICAQDLPEVVYKFVAIATPFGDQQIPLKGLTRFLIRNQLIPDFLSRPRFFSKQTPKEVQKALFKKVIPESDALIDIILADQWFHTELFNQPLKQESMVFASESDKIVPWTQTEIFAEKIGARFQKFSKNENVGHDDYVTAPKISQQISDQIMNFFLEGKDRW